MFAFRRRRCACCDVQLAPMTELSVPTASSSNRMLNEPLERRSS